MPSSIFGHPVDITYPDEWAFFMLLPFIAASLLALGLCILTLTWVWSAWTVSTLRADGRWRGGWTEFKAISRTPVNLYFKAVFTFLNIAFLPLTLQALQMLQCVPQLDGSVLLQVAPSLACSDPVRQAGRQAGRRAGRQQRHLNHPCNGHSISPC